MLRRQASPFAAFCLALDFKDGVVGQAVPSGLRAYHPLKLEKHVP